MATFKGFLTYAERQAKIQKTARQKMEEWVRIHGTDGNRDEMNLYAKALADRYGAAAGSAACFMYDEIRNAENANAPDAEMADIMPMDEVSFAMSGAVKQSESPALIGSVVERIVKQVAMDTMIKNAVRDGAVWAWVPYGETCAFCITLASRGWQPASKAQIRGGHAEHVHANCNCQFMISFKGGLDVKGYDPDKYLDTYLEAGGDINEIRREQYALNKEKINAQHREAYAIRKELNEG